MLTNPGGIPALSGEESEVFYALREHVEQLRHPLPGHKRRAMKDEEKVAEGFEEAMKRIMARMSPEQRLAGLAPEQRLAGLTEAQAVLALPDAILRGLSDEYLATLPKEVRSAIDKRLGRATVPRRSPARRRKPR